MLYTTRCLFKAFKLKKKGKKIIYYERRDEVNYETTIEIDFLIILDRKITPLEVKSSMAIKTKSLDKFKAKFKNTVNKGIVLYDGDIKISKDILYLPLFMADFL